MGRAIFGFAAILAHGEGAGLNQHHIFGDGSGRRFLGCGGFSGRLTFGFGGAFGRSLARRLFGG
jgi:hypothetical protein